MCLEMGDERLIFLLVRLRRREERRLAAFRRGKVIVLLGQLFMDRIGFGLLRGE